MWDFTYLTMQFTYKRGECLLQGIKPGAMQLLSGQQLSKCLQMVQRGLCLMVLITGQQTRLHAAPTPILLNIQQILLEYDDVFQLPVGLPLSRFQYHRIPLHDESKVINIKPYRHSSIQKTKIEKLVQEMLEAGIIKESNNLFSSPIVMVKKKYES